MCSIGALIEMTELTISIPTDVLKRAKVYAEVKQTSVESLISQFLSQFPVEDGYLKDAPIIQRLIGTLPPHMTVDDYWCYIEEKYTGDQSDNAALPG